MLSDTEHLDGSRSCHFPYLVPHRWSTIAVDEQTHSSLPFLSDSAPSSMPNPPSLFWLDPRAYMLATSMNPPYADPGLYFMTVFKRCLSTFYAEVGNLTLHSLGAYMFNTILRSSLIFFRTGPLPNVPVQGPAAVHNHVQVCANAALRCPSR